jgi:hypothetical protein
MADNMATENEITIESRPTLAERVAARAAELERQGWTRAAADGLAKDGLAKEGLRLWPTWNLPERKAEKSRAER